jgi:alanine racemase
VSAPDRRSATVATVDLSALAHNLSEVRRLIPSACRIFAVVKADAYGHGLVEVARALARRQVGGFAVATVQEAVSLRNAGIREPVLVMAGLLPDETPELIRYGLTPVVYDRTFATRLAEQIPANAAPWPIHLKIDTGMGRLGFTPAEAWETISNLRTAGRLRIEGLMTHLADADSADPAYTNRQLAVLDELVTRARLADVPIPLVHAAGTAGILAHPASHRDAVRPGLMLYGYHTCEHLSAPVTLQPVLSLSSKVIQIRSLKTGDSVSYNRTFIAKRPSRIAVLPIGYADGYSRALSDRASVLVRGSRAPVVGRVCMDLTMIDVTDVPGATAGDDVILLGRQETESITADDLAGWQDSIPYEVLCAIGTRVPRIYRPDEPAKN